MFEPITSIQNCMFCVGSRFQREAYVVPIGAIDEEKNWKKWAILVCNLVVQTSLR